MSKKFITLAVIGILIHVTCASVAMAKNPSDKEASFAEKVKAGIAKLGTGKDSLVKVKLRDGTRLNGYLSEVNENSFVVTDRKTGAATTVLYPQVKQVKGNNLSSGAKIAIAIGALLALTIVLAVALRGH